MTLKTTLIKMLKENTGIAMCDSGGTDGRAWQRNQDKIFENEPRVTINEYGVTVSVFHYLNEILELNDFARKVNKFITKKKLHWCEDVAEEIKIIYPKIEKFYNTVNTYNGDSNLSQVLLFKTFKMYNNDVYVLLQIHEGCDVRGGYTDTKCFKLNGYLGLVDVYGSIDDKEFSNIYNGYSLTWEDNNEEVNLNKLNFDEVSIDFYVHEETYMYE